MISFELEHCEMSENKGYYLVKCLKTGQNRDITQLSTGEKNIIAFLYFIEKLEEVNEGEVIRKNKIIVFDDPMNSNDDNMQYLIIEELQSLMKKIQETEMLVLLTHNKHFYLNVKYGRKYKQDTFIRFEYNGEGTSFNYITNENDDFKTSYESLWNEVKLLYGNEQACPEMLLNPIRRIIETYTKFNALSQKDFCEKQSGAMKLFNVNSHSIDDLEADLNGKTKKEIIELMMRCFENNDSKAHFNKYWTGFDKSEEIK